MSKKILSLVLAVVMLLSTASIAMASSEPGTKTITGDGETIYIDDTIFDTTLPTEDTFEFTLDPQGLTEIAEGESVSVSDLEGGKIITPEAPSMLINNSSFPVKLTAEFQATTTAGDNGKSDSEKVEYPAATFVTDMDDVAADTANNVLFYVAASSSEIADPSKDAYKMPSEGIAFGDTKLTLEFAFDAAEAVIKNTGGTYAAEIVEGTGSGTAVKLGGYVNKNADWSGFVDGVEGTASTIGLTIAYKFEKDTATYEEDDFDATSGSFGLLTNASTDRIKLSTGASFPTTYEIASKDSNAVLEFDPGDTDLTLASGYMQTTWKGAPYNGATWGSTFLKFEGNKLTILSKTFKDAGIVLPLTIEVKDSEDNTYQCVISLAD